MNAFIIINLVFCNFQIKFFFVDFRFWHGSTNENSRDKMKKILSMAVLNELTERQRICIVDYYLNGKKEKEIAKELGVNSSTVSRHIMKARDKLRHIASYYVN